MKNAAIVVLSVLLVLALLWVYALKSEIKSAKSTGAAAEMKAGSMTLSPEADKACHERAQAHYRAGDIEGGDLASAQCYDLTLFEEKKQQAWLTKYRRNQRQLKDTYGK
jgi:hypothetical protein